VQYNNNNITVRELNIHFSQSSTVPEASDCATTLTDKNKAKVRRGEKCIPEHNKKGKSLEN